ncbi:MAG TPA: hypothetical protein VMR41_03000 [Patescibacteria group bacterium]|nr:hypothetical protein [Patescibacteria group bacterium]
MKITIKNAKIWKTGSGSSVITIPMDYVKNGILKIGNNYSIEIEVDADVEVTNNEQLL